MFHPRSIWFGCLVAALPLLCSAPSLNRPPKDSTPQQRIDFYITRLGDPKYVEYRKHDGTDLPWYVAAEELGRIGSPAVSPLVEKLRTSTDAYERTITFYALLLAAQAQEITAALGQTIPDYPLALPPKEDHDRVKKLWLDWWTKYGTTIQKLASERLAHQK